MKKVSIVICTYNRAPFLKRTLKSLSRLNYKNFEVIVINGPSTDDTETVLQQYRGFIKKGNNPEANLSVSRNMGIKLSAGEIVAFIDDDAIPDKYWLDDIVSEYEKGYAWGVGGKVFGPGDDHFQFENGYVNFWGEADPHCIGENHNTPDGDKYNMMLGTNCTFLRKALEEVGGFDEYYEYFHDESDLCLRVVRAGCPIVNHEHAYIHHEYAKSHIRENTFDPCHLNWYPIIKNKVYFVMKNSIGFATDEEREKKVRQIQKEHIDSFKHWFKTKKITKEEYQKYMKMCEEGVEKGYRDGKNQERKLNYNLQQNEEFLIFDCEKMKQQVLTICLMSKDNIFDSIGGTAKHTYELAKGFSNYGHDVHVIISGEKEADWMCKGISMHSIQKEKKISLPELEKYPTTEANVQYSYQVYKKIMQIHNKYHVDMIESALWDFEGSVAAHLLKGKIPVAVRLQTPLLKVAETQNWKITEDLKIFTDFEAQMIKDAAGIIPISDHIVETISELYPGCLHGKKMHKVYLGVDENKCLPQRKDDNKFQILFVGRLERRKGIHTIFEVLPELMEKYPNVELKMIGNTEIIDEKLNMSFKQYFEKKYVKKPWYHRVKFCGQVDNEVKDQAFADCDLFIAPSLYESFGIILIEAMSAKKPVIGCKIGGMQELIEDGKNGYAIEVENAQELLYKIKILIEDNMLLNKFSEQAFAIYQEKFSNKVMIENTISAYHRFMKIDKNK